ncbi:MAG: energy transducer TonB [Terriglobales bacterium]
MFRQLQPFRLSKPLLFSLAGHCALLYFVIIAGPRFIQPSSIAFGNQGKGLSVQVVYLGPSSAPLHAALTAPKPRNKHSHKAERSTPKPMEQPAPETPVESARAGSIVGSSLAGPQTGYEARPALPVVFPNPAVDRSDIPSGVAGDVVVEVTIDEKGNVANTKVLESLGYGLEDKVLEALKNWRFTPATMNGVAIASRQDVHFHFPS